MLRGRNDPAPDRGTDSDDWWHGQSTWAKSGTVCTILLIEVLFVCGAIVAWGAASGPARTHAAPAAPASPARNRVVPADPKVMSRNAPVSSVPANVTWLRVGLGALPFSTGAGPTAVRSGVPSGFAHTQAGAVIASMQILGRLSWSAQTKASMRAVAAASTMPTAQAVASLTYDPPADPSLIPAVAGYQVVTYSPAQAVINMSLRFNGALRVVPATMQFAGGDWKLAGAPGPLNQTSWAEIADLTGYVLFSGEPTSVGD